MKQFQRSILSWYKKNGRHKLPWRQTQDPYKILVSEVMLQQTQVSRVLQKYDLFLNKFPTVEKLARAKTRDVLLLWQGLGYNNRALRLKQTARIIKEKYSGLVPNNTLSLQELPGVGNYTARAIRVFSFEAKEVLIETNIRRVFIYHFFRKRKTVFDRELTYFIKETLPKSNIREWYFALMDYGAIKLSNVENPNRKSNHYKKQTIFQGSQRFARSVVLRMILERGLASDKSLRKTFSSHDSLKSQNYQKVLRGLTKDGLIYKKQNSWAVIA